MLSAALWQTGKGRRISLASTRRSCLRFAERSGDKPFDTSIFRGFEMAYLVRAQMHKRRQIPRKCLLNQGLKDESSLKTLSEQEKGNYAVWNLSGIQIGKLTRLSDCDPEPLNGMPIATEISHAQDSSHARGEHPPEFR